MSPARMYASRRGKVVNDRRILDVPHDDALGHRQASPAGKDNPAGVGLSPQISQVLIPMGLAKRIDALDVRVTQKVVSH